MPEDARIIALVRGGDTDAFAEIVENYQLPLRRYLYRLTGDYDIAQDLTQDTFLQAYQNILKTKADISLKAWLFKIATNNAWMQGRRKKLWSFIRQKPEILPSENDPLLNERDMAVQQTLIKVPADYRVCMVLHLIEGFKYHEIAETLGISEEAVRKRVARGREEFSKQYNRENQ